MAAMQAQRHELGRAGQDVARQLLGGKQQAHKAPFDVVDFNTGMAYEVKTMSGLSTDLKIHIAPDSMRRKKAFLRKWHLTAALVAVVIYSENDIRVYKGKLVASCRVNQMKAVKGGE